MVTDFTVIVIISYLSFILSVIQLSLFHVFISNHSFVPWQPLQPVPIILIFTGALSGLRQFLATQSPLKTMKNGFYFTLKALLVLKIFKLLS